METYYGDTTIQSMADHTKQIVENLDEFLQSMETGENEERN
jgi:L-arabinose isomerase